MSHYGGILDCGHARFPLKSRDGTWHRQCSPFTMVLRLAFIAHFLLATAVTFAAPASAQSPPAGTISGTVVETREGAPVQKVAVRLQDTGQTVITDDQGRFEFTGVAPGSHELYVSAVDFILVKRVVTVSADAPAIVTISLTEGTGTFTETVTVQGAASERQEPDVAAAETITSKELQQLRGLVTNDPLRAIQVMPGVATGDDLRSEFTVRGHNVDHMQFTFDGVSTPLLLHTVQRLFDSGSLSMVNGDVLEEVSLLNGAYPQRYGDRLGAEIDFRMRQGSRDRVQTRLSVSGTDAAVVMEGPLGRSKRGSWLVSARKSYLDLVIARLGSDVDFAFGFTDFQSKLVYDVEPGEPVSVLPRGGTLASRSAGRSTRYGRCAGRPERVGAGCGVVAVSAVSPFHADTADGRHRQHTTATSTADGVELARGSAQDALYRADWSYAPNARLTVEGGGEARWSAAAKRDLRLAFLRAALRGAPGFRRLGVCDVGVRPGPPREGGWWCADAGCARRSLHAHGQDECFAVAPGNLAAHHDSDASRRHGRVSPGPLVRAGGRSARHGEPEIGDGRTTPTSALKAASAPRRPGR